MFDETILQRLAEGVTPSDDLKKRIKARMQRSIEPVQMKAVASALVPSPALRHSLKQKILRALHGSPVADELQDLVLASGPSLSRLSLMRQAVLGRLLPDASVSFVHSSLKWGAAFAVFLLLVRAMPLVFLAPTTKADVGVQLIPSGNDISVLVGGVWRSVTTSEVVRGPLMIRTGASRATVILNDDGVVRLEPETTFKIHDIGDRPHFTHSGPTATLVRGRVWVLGLLQPLDDGLSIETSQGDIVVNSGSASIEEENDRMTVAVYDRGITYRFGDQKSFLVSGEKGIVRNTADVAVSEMPARAFAESWVSGNLEQDAVHRSEIAALQQQRRERMAGILPTSILYPAKRIAEKVDVLFTLSQDGRSAKLVEQADTRLSEALALVNEGQNTEAVVPLTEYRDSLIAMAGGTGDNLVKFLIKRQLADATASITPLTSSGKIELVRTALTDVTASIPDTALQAKDIEGYVLVDKLTKINRTLVAENSLTGALVAYAEVSPYLAMLLDEKDGTHPLLQKEARSLLVTTSSLIKEAAKGGDDKVLVAVQSDIDRYLPEETESVLVSEEELNQSVQTMLNRIFIFKAPLSRYNQLMTEMSGLRGNPNRGTLLRRLFRSLPEFGLGGYVLTEIKNFGDELKGR